MINKVILIGRVGAKPTLKESQNGTKYCSFSMVTDSGYGEKKVSDWHSVTCFSKLAETAEKYLDKGKLIYLSGRLQYETYERDGKKQKSVKIIADELQFLSGKNQSQEDSEQSHGVQTSIPEHNATAQSQAEDNPFVDDINMEEIPF